MTDDKPRYSATSLQTNYLPKSYLVEQLDRKIAALGTTHALPAHVPTITALRTLWMKRMPFYNVSERIESEVGFEEWVNAFLEAARGRQTALIGNLQATIHEKDRRIAELEGLLDVEVDADAEASLQQENLEAYITEISDPNNIIDKRNS